MSFALVHELKLLGTATLYLSLVVGGIEQLVGRHHIVDINALVGNGFIEVCYCAVTHLFDGTHECRFLKIDFAVFTSALEQLASIFRRSVGTFVDGLLYFVAGLGSDNKIEPVEFGLLGRRGENFDRVARRQFVVELAVASVDLASDA